MDTAPGNTSPVPVSEAGINNGLHGYPWIRHSMVLLGIGLVCGAIAAGISIWVPTNRVVVSNQRYSTYVTIDSVRIARKGFVVVYFDDIGEFSVQQPYYLTPGYYRNLTVPISADAVIERSPKILSLYVRLYVDNGDGKFDPVFDTPVKDMFGRLINEHFWLEYGTNSVKSGMRAFMLHPIGNLVNYLFP
jgi:hypothetical protein